MVTEVCKYATWIHSDLSERENRISSYLALRKFESSELNFELIIDSQDPKKSSYAKLIFEEKF